MSIHLAITAVAAGDGFRLFRSGERLGLVCRNGAGLYTSLNAQMGHRSRRAPKATPEEAAMARWGYYASEAIRRARETIVTPWLIERAVAGEVICNTGQVNKATERALDKLVRDGTLLKWRGKWYPVAGAAYGLGPDKTCWGLTSKYGRAAA